MGASSGWCGNGSRMAAYVPAAMNEFGPDKGFGEFVAEVNTRWLTAKSATTLRYGQHFYNTLYDMHPRLADRIRSTHRDPFHRDEVEPHIWDYCDEQWDTTYF